MSMAKVSVAKMSFDAMEMNVKSHKHRNEQGLGWVVTGLFIVGDLAGGGIVALPTAIVRTDFWAGLVLNIIMGMAMCYTASLLGKSWVIMQQRWPEYHEHCRKPYPEMGGKAMGIKIKHFVSVCIDLTQFGIAVVFLLLCAKNIRDFLNAFVAVDFSFCYVIIIVGICLLPITFLKSPQDFWWAVVLAMVTTTCALILIMIGAFLDVSTCHPVRGTNQKTVASNYLLGLGTFLFAYGGHASFPTILHDMEKPYRFTRSSILAFIVIWILYLPICIIGYYTYGNSLQDSIINSVQSTGIQQGANILITLHCILTLTIVFNPLNQEAEEIFGVPHNFCWQRVLVRTAMMCLIIFVAESLPTFGPLLDLVGGSTLTLTSLVFPCLFYMFIMVGDEMAIEKEADKKKSSENYRPPTLSEVITRTPKLRLGICAFIIIFGLAGGTAATYTALRELASTHFVAPCYVQPFLTDRSSSATISGNHTNCCGHWQNVTRFGDSSMCNPFRDFYDQYDH